MTTTNLQLMFAGSDPGPLVERARAAGLLPAEPPSSTRVDHRPVDGAGPLPALVAGAGELWVEWGDDAWLRRNRDRDQLTLCREAWPITAEATLALLAELPFEACTTAAIDPTWWGDYRSIHGWGFALKGAGHRLVSPRIRDRGPWRVLRDEQHDVTLFQFHDLAADEATALAQARPGHALLAPVWEGGHYASQAWVFRGSADAYQPTFYDRANRTSIVLVQDREVTPAEMGIAAATRVHAVFPEPIDQVAFVFLDEATARRQLPALWLHGLEVRAMTADGERRLDLDYPPPPPPPPPSWVTGGR